ncbi:TetR family transcriptional regulator [Sulfitobacter porphyrae]|nr:TetR family transcriptional regulator [Sulfitobacter porphyrae]
MRVSREQAEENQQTVLNTDCRLFCEQGFDGIGLKDLMKGAGLTQGAFYKQFASKDDLIVQASGRAMKSGDRRWASAVEAQPEDPLASVVAFYLSMEHRAQRMDGCPIVALSGDAARKGAEVKAPFEAGIRAYLEQIGDWIGESEGDGPGLKVMATLSTMVGAMMLSRAINDEGLSRQILEFASQSILNRPRCTDAAAEKLWVQ